MKRNFFYSKIFFLLFFITTITLPVFSQQETVEEDVVYLVNGSVIHGKIIEYKSGEYVKIKSCNRNVWVFNENEIDRIVKEEIIIVPDSLKLTDKEGYFNFTQIGVLAGSRTSAYAAPLSIQTINGYKYKGGLFLGGGIGVEFFSDISVPVFADIRYRLLNNDFSPYLFVNVGYSLPMENSLENRNAKGGPMSSLGFGVIVPLNIRTSLNFNIGYRYQQLLYVENDYWTAYETERYEVYNRIDVKIGFLFH